MANLVLRMTTAQGRTLVTTTQKLANQMERPWADLVVAAGPCVKLHNQLGPKQASAHSIPMRPATWMEGLDSV